MDDLQNSGSFRLPQVSDGLPADGAGDGCAGTVPFDSPADLDGADVAVDPTGLLCDVAVTIRSTEARGLSRDDLESGLGKLVAVRSAVDACEARFAAELDRLDDFGEHSFAVLRRLSGCSAPVAKRSSGRAAALREMPNLADALNEGHITAEHADVLVAAAEFAGAEVVDDAAELFAAASVSNVERTRRVVSDWMRGHREGLTPGERYERQRGLRRLSMSQTAEGMTKATALLDPATGAAFKSLIDDVAQRFAEADRRDARPEAPEPRSYAQCRADALAALVGIDGHRAAQRWYDEVQHGDAEFVANLNGASLPETPPPLAADQLMRLPTDLEAASESLRRRNQVVIVADTRAVLGDQWADCEIPGTGPIPTHVLERLACGAELFGLLFDGDGQPLWHGRKVRTVTDAQWRALVARDRHCVLCDLAPGWCEAHHIVPWKHPACGRTDIDNLALLCFRCHDQLHSSGARLERVSPASFTIAYKQRRE